MTKRKFKGLLILFAILVIALVAFFYPEHAESVARALMLVVGVV
jgi:hypothetical protein